MWIEKIHFYISIILNNFISALEILIVFQVQYTYAYSYGSIDRHFLNIKRRLTTPKEPNETHFCIVQHEHETSQYNIWSWCSFGKSLNLINQKSPTGYKREQKQEHYLCSEQCLIEYLLCFRLQILHVHTQHDIRRQCGRRTPRSRLDRQEHATSRSPAHSAEDTLHREGITFILELSKSVA